MPAGEACALQRTRRMDRAPRALVGFAIAALFALTPCTARADGWEFAVYGGQALPLYEGRLSLALPAGALPGVTVRPSGDLVLEAVGRPVFGAAVAWTLTQALAVEGRLDTAGLAIDTSAVQYDFTIDSPLVPIGRASLALAPTRVHVDRLTVVSANLRGRTPGRVSVFASGGLSYLPRLAASGTVPLAIRIDGVTIPTDATLRVGAAPARGGHRFGVNGGGGVRAEVGPRLAVFAETRVFAFRSYALAFVPDAEGAGIEALLGALPTVEFAPRYFHGAAGIAIRF
jgi:hypothetical protein